MSVNRPYAQSMCPVGMPTTGPQSSHQITDSRQSGRIACDNQQLPIARLEAHDIHLREARTRQAVADFNTLQAQHARVVAALHLTC